MHLISFVFRRIRRRLAILLALVATPVAAGGTYLGVLQLTGNFHEVVPGELYRSAQLTPEAIVEYKQRFGIKTIVNLRGESVQSRWYGAEAATAAQLGISLRNFRMSAEEELSETRAGELVRLLASAEAPILIHCKAGADRTGLAAALYLWAVKRGSADVAGRQISLRYGHWSVPLSPAYAMDRTFEKLRPWIAFLRSGGPAPEETAVALSD